MSYIFQYFEQEKFGWCFHSSILRLQKNFMKILKKSESKIVYKNSGKKLL